MVDAHMDEIGFIISHVEKEGLLRFAPLGSWDPRVFPAHQVVIQTRLGKNVMGTIGMPPPHVQAAEERKTVIPIDDLFIDVGVSSAEEAIALGIEIGVPGTLATTVETLKTGTIMGKALDNRIGCALLVEILEYFSQHVPDYTLVANFATGEEVGLRGATTAAYMIDPQLALVLESTVGDTLGLPDRKQPSRLGRGAVITVADKRTIVPPYLIKFLTNLAARENIPIQYKTPLYGSTDAGVIHTTRGGVPTAVLSVPCRYIHSPNGIMKLEDYESVFRLAISFLKNARQALHS
jgi:endoglucanase